MGSRVGQQRRGRGARGPGASPAGVGVWPHVRMRRHARIRLHARACKPVHGLARARSNHKEHCQHNQRRRARGARGPCMCMRA